MNPLLRQFLAEGRELVQDASDGLLAIERDTGDREAVVRVFRGFHTLKGSAGLFEFRPLTAVLHAAEDILAEVRDGRRAIGSDLVDTLLNVLDQVGRWLDGIEAEGRLPAGAEATGAALEAELRERAGPGTPPGGRLGEAVRAVPPEAPPDWLAGLAEGDRFAALSHWLRQGNGAPLVAVAYDPDPGCFFNGDDPVNLMRRVPGLSALSLAPRAPWPPAVELDPFACALSLRGLAVAEAASVRDVFRFVSDQVRIAEIRPETLIAVPDPPPADPRAHGFLRQARRRMAGADWQGLREAVAASMRPPPTDRTFSAVLNWLALLLDAPDVPPQWLETLLTALEGAPAHRPIDRVRTEVVRAVLTEQRRFLATPCAEAEFDGRIGAAARVAANALIYQGREDEARRIAEAEADTLAGRTAAPLLDLLDRVLGAEAPEPAAEPAAEAGAALRAAPRVLRVDETRIDRLMALVGEMIVAKNALSFLARRAEQDAAAESQARALRDLHGVIDRLTRDLHGAVIQVRMLPVGQIFQRFPRLVRDIARRLGRSVDLVIEGEDTEADKAVVEAVFEPLLHLVRNALDHGIEPPEQRTAAGKPDKARLLLRAFQENDQMVVEVIDDGRGIDPASVRRKAVEKGLLAAEDAESLSDEEAVGLIFAPGFTTASQVSDLSGRGIGMDAVRSAVEKAGGSVGVTSRPGQGTAVRLALPLSLAVLRVMTVAVGRHRFGVPLDVIAETALVPRERILRIKSHDAFVLRDRIVPLLRLGRLLDLPGEAAREAAGDARVLVVETDGRVAGIEVDAHGERLDAVLRPMEGLLAGIPGYLGTTLTGDGRVLLVLDLKELLR